MQRFALRGFGFLATAFSATAAFAHGTERGFVMLLPTGYYQIGAAVAVAASFALLTLVPGAFFAKLAEMRWLLFRARLPARAPVSIFAFSLLAILVGAGFFATADPLENPLPLFVWTFWWVGVTLLQAIVGNLWPWINPWTGPLALLRFLTRRPTGTLPIIGLPASLGHAPAVAIFFCFAWFELISLAPEDPANLAGVVVSYWGATLCAMVFFGEAQWTQRGEPFSVYFQMIGRLAPLQAEPVGSKDEVQFSISWPGRRCLQIEPLASGSMALLLLTLGTASFDGFSETFTWLSLIGINPLEFPGRSAVVGVNSLGLTAAPIVLGFLYMAAIVAGALLAGERSGRRIMSLACHLAYSVLPISVAFHGAHYLTLLLVNGQYLIAVLSDPFALGWNLFGSADWHVSTSFLTNIEGARQIWIAQTAVIVAGHCVGILLAHMIALRHFATSRQAALSQVFLALAMVFYTVFGLWLLSTPSSG